MSAKGVRKLVSPFVGLVHSSRFTNLLVQNVMRDGKRSLAVRLVSEAWERVVQDLGLKPADSEAVVERMEVNMMCRIDFIKRRVGSRHHKIPYMIDEDRAYRKSLKRFQRLTNPKKGGKGGLKEPYSKVLARELANLYRGTGTMANYKVNLYKEAWNNRAFQYLIRRFHIRDEGAFVMNYTPEFIRE